MSHWANMFISSENKGNESKKHTEGIILKDIPSEVILPSGYQIKNLSEITKEHTGFIVRENKTGTGNIGLLDATLSTASQGYIFELSKDQKINGFILSIPHRIKLLSFNSNKIFQDIEAGVTTSLCVSEDHRKRALAMALIKSVIMRGYENKIYTAYHYIKENKTGSAVKLNTWYRILNPVKAHELGYTVTVPKQNKVKNPMKQAILRYTTFKTPSDWEINPTTYLDLSFLDNTSKRLSISKPSEEEFKRLSETPFRWLTIKNGNSIKGIVVYRPFMVYISKTKKLAITSQLIFFESEDTSALDCMNLFMKTMLETNHVVVYGVTMGALVDIESNLKISSTGNLYLDFYNFHIDNLQPKEVNLIYI